MSATVRFVDGWAEVALRCDACQQGFAAVRVAVHRGGVRPMFGPDPAGTLAVNQARALGAYYHGLDFALHRGPGVEPCDAHTCAPCRAAQKLCRCEACHATREEPFREHLARLAEANQPRVDADPDAEPFDG